MLEQAAQDRVALRADQAAIVIVETLQQRTRLACLGSAQHQSELVEPQPHLLGCVQMRTANGLGALALEQRLEVRQRLSGHLVSGAHLLPLVGRATALSVRSQRAAQCELRAHKRRARRAEIDRAVAGGALDSNLVERIFMRKAQHLGDAFAELVDLGR